MSLKASSVQEKVQGFKYCKAGAVRAGNIDAIRRGGCHFLVVPPSPPPTFQVLPLPMIIIIIILRIEEFRAQKYKNCLSGGGPPLPPKVSISPLCLFCVCHSEVPFPSWPLR